jgi:hypothetical protein
MRPSILLFALTLGLVACDGEKTTPRPPGDPAVAGDPGGQTGDNATPGDNAAPGDSVTPGDATTPGDSVTPGDAIAAVTPPSHIKVNSGSGAASSTNYKARIRVGGPMPPGAASGSGKKIQGSTPASP